MSKDKFQESLACAQIYESESEINKLLVSLDSSDKIVYTYGVWDLLHPGHINFLYRASKLGSFLIVGVVADKPVHDLKGPDRPTQSQSDRIITVGTLRFVDAAIKQPEYDPSPQLRSLHRVDILTKGDDWELIPGTKTIEELGGELIKFSYTEGFSTSALVSKMNKDSNEI